MGYKNAAPKAVIPVGSTKSMVDRTDLEQAILLFSIFWSFLQLSTIPLIPVKSKSDSLTSIPFYDDSIFAK